MSPSLCKIIVLAATTLLPTVFAVPNVTAVPITGGCQNYPGWDASTQIAGPWIIQTSKSDSPVEGYGDSYQVNRVSGDTGIHMGRIDIVDNNQLAKSPLRCNGSRGKLEALTASGVSGYAWNALSIAPYPYDAELMWGVSGPEVQAYNHYVGGVQQPGVFLGSDNVTTWGLMRWGADYSTDGRPFWQFRLLGPNSALPWNGSALYPSEYTTFIKILA